MQYSTIIEKYSFLSDGLKLLAPKSDSTQKATYVIIAIHRKDIEEKAKNIQIKIKCYLYNL